MSPVERYIRMCYERHPPTKEELHGKTFEECVTGDIAEFETYYHEPIRLLMEEYDHNPEIVDYPERLRWDSLPVHELLPVQTFLKLLTKG